MNDLTKIPPAFAADWTGGMKIECIAKKYKRSQRTIYLWAAALGIEDQRQRARDPRRTSTPEGFAEDYMNTRMTLRELAAKYGVSFGCVRKWVERSDIPRRRDIRRTELTDDERLALRDMVYQGCSKAHISVRLGMSKEKLQQYMDEMGLETTYQRKLRESPSNARRSKALRDDQLCWGCALATGGGAPPCPWATSKAREPVEGWDAVPLDNGGYLILGCPLFKPG